MLVKNLAFVQFFRKFRIYLNCFLIIRMKQYAIKNNESTERVYFTSKILHFRLQYLFGYFCKINSPYLKKNMEKKL